jgi:undecaprenyl phosphate-alpha-L-ara4N flippase subunit ArnE
MPLRSLLLTVATVLMIAIGQLLFKSAASQWNVDGFTWKTAAGFLSPLMISALALYGVATVLWVYVLRTVPLSAAYAVFALAFLIVPILAHFMLDEPLTPNVLIGGAVIVAGIFIAVR